MSELTSTQPHEIMPELQRKSTQVQSLGHSWGLQTRICGLKGRNTKGSLSPTPDEADTLTVQLSKRPNLGGSGNTLASPMAESMLWPIHSQLEGERGSGVTVWHFICASSMARRDCEGRRDRLSELRNLSSVTGYIKSQNKKPPMKKSPSKHAFTLNKSFTKPV